jgi:hypothetical protein
MYSAVSEPIQRPALKTASTSFTPARVGECVPRRLGVELER